MTFGEWVGHKVGFVLGLFINVGLVLFGLGRHRERIARWLEPK